VTKFWKTNHLIIKNFNIHEGFAQCDELEQCIFKSPFSTKLLQNIQDVLTILTVYTQTFNK